MNIIEILSERRIQDALDQGLFDHLPGEGKPLKWKDNTHTPIENRLAYDLLQQNGFTLPWIEKGKAIRDEILLFRQALQKEIRRDDSALPAKTEMESLKDRLGQINEKIMDYNKSVPLGRFQVSLLNLTLELERLKTKPSSTSKDWQ